MSIKQSGTDEQFSRTVNLLGEEAFERLASSAVIVFGLGGVGSYAVEALVRSGISKIGIVDGDVVEKSNLNRQLFADAETLGKDKTEAAERRIKLINPYVCIEKHQLFYAADTADNIDLTGYDFIIDAIDTVTSKLILIERAYALGVPIISSMGTGNKLDPSKLKISPIKKTSVCPLARVMRRELKSLGIFDIPVLWSDELPKKPEEALSENGRHPPASWAVVPGCAGLMLAGYVMERLVEK